MKLVNVLARTTKKWPDGIDALVQGSDGSVYTAGGGIIFIRADLAEDWELAEVTRAEWQAAVDDLNCAPQNDDLKNVAPTEWDGEGAPKVGTACEYFGWYKGVQAWRRCVVIAHDNRLTVVNHDGFYSGQELGALRPVRPIRTPEQVEAGYRSIECGQIYDILCRETERGGNHQTMAEALYDAGYHKQVMP